MEMHGDVLSSETGQLVEEIQEMVSTTQIGIRTKDLRIFFMPQQGKHTLLKSVKRHNGEVYGFGTTAVRS
jgi:hypothetical protein